MSNLPVGQIFAEVDAMNYNYEFPKLIFPSQKIQQQQQKNGCRYSLLALF